MVLATVLRHSLLILLAFGAALLTALPARGEAPLAWLLPAVPARSQPVAARGQAPAEQQDEIKVLVRISKQLIEDVAAREEIVAAIPYSATVLGFCCQGVIDGRGKVAV